MDGQFCFVKTPLSVCASGYPVVPVLKINTKALVLFFNTGYHRGKVVSQGIFILIHLYE